jgi:RHS repeat-associated protein
MRFFAALFSIFFANTLIATDVSEGSNSSPTIATIDHEPSCMAANVVNVISGAFCDSQIDLVVAGPEPIVIDRGYTSSCFHDGTISRGWSFGFAENLKYHVNDTKHTHEVFLKGAYGQRPSFYWRKKHNPGPFLKMPIEFHELCKGYNNLSSGVLSAKTNPHSFAVRYFFKTNHCELDLGDGKQRVYNPRKHLKETYQLDWEVSPVGNKLTYSWDKTHWDSHKRVQTIVSQDKWGNLFAKVQMVYPKDHKTMKIQSFDGREVVYGFYRQQYKETLYEKGYMLSHVTRPNAPQEWYFYKKNSIRVSKKARPDDRFLEIDYYHDGTNHVGKDTVKIHSSHNLLLGRVKLLKAPVGKDNSPIITHRFFYDLNYDELPSKTRILKDGKTDVYDANNNRTRYKFSKDLKLESIEKFDQGNTLYTKEKLFWGERFTYSCLNLLSRTFEDGQGNVLFCRTFEYDEKGNVLQDSLIGNLLGNGVEKYTKSFTYDEKNQMTFMDEGRRKTYFTYTSDSSLLASKIVRGDDGLSKREFYAYDPFGTCIKEVKDDGTGENEGDLTGVTYRFIKTVQPTTNFPVGRPYIVVEKYYDSKSKQEMLLKKTINTFSREGNLVEQQVFDATDCCKYTKKMDYDALGNVIFEQDALGQQIVRSYDSNGNLIFQQGPRSDIHEEYTYDFSNRLIEKREVANDGITRVSSFDYDYLGNKVGEIDCFGNETRFEYDPFNRVTKKIFPDGTFQKTEYDEMSHPKTIIDANGGCTHKKYTIRGQSASATYPDGSCESWHYSPDGNLIMHQAVSGIVTHFSYDSMGHVIEKKHFASSGDFLFSTSASYSSNHLLYEVDAAGRKTEYFYDGAGRLIEKKERDKRTCYFYDSLGRQNKTVEYYSPTEALVTFLEFDLLGRVIEERKESVSGDLLTKVCYELDPTGNKVSVIQWNRDGVQVTTNHYSPRGELIQTEDPLGNRTTVVYDYSGSGLCVSTIDPLGKISRKKLDFFGRLIEEEVLTPFGKTVQRTTHRFDCNGNKIESSHAVLKDDTLLRTYTIQWAYDCCNREIRVVEGVGEKDQKTFEKFYNTFGQLAKEVTPNGITLSYFYDLRGRVGELKSSDGTVHYCYVYDTLDNLVSVNDLIQNVCTQRTYDEANRLIKERQGSTLVIQYTYDGFGRPLKTFFPDGSFAKYNYNPISLLSVERSCDKHLYLEQDWCGNVLLEETFGKKINHSYDKLNRLVDLKTPGFSQTNIHYDPSGNLLSYTLGGKEGQREYSFRYDYLGQLIEEVGHSYQYDSIYNRVQKDAEPNSIDPLNRLLSDGVSTFSYDRNGNCISENRSGKIFQYQYDALNRLITVTFDREKYCYTYDSFHRRVSKTHYTSNVLQKKCLYLYQGEDEVGAFSADGRVQELRILGRGKGAEIGAAVFVELQGKVFAPLHDHNGNVMALMTKEGDVFEEYRYSAFGEESLPSSGLNPWRFSSKRVDPETGFSFFGRRYYNPTCGRWLSSDPLGFNGGTNLYAYVSNSPLIHIDLYGLIQQGDGAQMPWFFHLPLQYLAAPVGHLLQFIGDHLIPIPFVRDSICLVGSILSGNGVADYRRSDRQPHSKIFDLGKSELSLMERIIIFNGILVDKLSAFQAASDISGRHGGNNVHGMYNATHGFLTDVFEVLCQKFGIPTNSVNKAVKLLRQQIGEVGGEGGGGRVTCYAHSQGGEILYQALEKLSPQERKMIHVVTMGSARMIPQIGLGSATNYVSCRDAVPFVSDPYGILLACFGRRDYNVRFLGSSNWPCIDHFMAGETYSKVIDTQGKEFKVRAGLL